MGRCVKPITQEVPNSGQELRNVRFFWCLFLSSSFTLQRDCDSICCWYTLPHRSITASPVTKSFIALAVRRNHKEHLVWLLVTPHMGGTTHMMGKLTVFWPGPGGQTPVDNITAQLTISPHATISPYTSICPLQSTARREIELCQLYVRRQQRWAMTGWREVERWPGPLPASF